MAETEAERATRRGRRLLFDDVAELYDTVRQSYPLAIVESLLDTAGVQSGGKVLEIGCGTGQLTQRLAGRGLDVLAIDIGPTMVAAARRNVNDSAVRFEVSAFEELDASGPFDLIVSATAFHWIDPEVGLPKAADLLRPGGWLGLLGTGERYPDQLRAALRSLWARFAPEDKLAARLSWEAQLQESALFEPAGELNDERSVRLTADEVLGVESTRATFLSYRPEDQAAFRAEFASALAGADVDVVQETFVALAWRNG